MFKNFRLQLTIILIVFSLVLSLVIAIFDYGKLKDRVLIGQAAKIELAEDKIIESLATIDKVYGLLDYQTGNEMEKNSYELLKMYEADPDFDNWDFQELNQRFGMDVFIVDANNIVIHSNLTYDLGLDFNECCPKFSGLLTERRMGNLFFDDGMDLQQHTGEIKKFSYMPTPDNKYLLELAVALEDEEIFKKFDFQKTTSQLVGEHDFISSINVYNFEGFYLTMTDKEISTLKVSSEMYPVFLDAYESGQPKEFVRTTEDLLETHRFIPYVADEIRGLSTNRVVEIVYNDSELTGLLGTYHNEFIKQLIAIMIAAIGLSLIIARLVAKPIHLAFHDSLTGLRNRAAFEEDIKRLFAKKKNPVSLMMIDLDNFKLVNDTLGHGEGDKILQLAASTIQEVAGQGNSAARIGGDEFVVTFTGLEEQEIRRIASDLVSKMNEELSKLPECGNIDVSISVGIAYADEGDDIKSLAKKADQALYVSKKQGKNQFNFYDTQNAI